MMFHTLNASTKTVFFNTFAWTKRLIPDLRQWITRVYGWTSYGLTQLLSGHGAMRAGLNAAGLVPLPECLFCAGQDDVEHAFFKCRRFAKERMLTKKMNEMKPTLGVVPEPKLEKGTRAVPYTGKDFDESHHAMRLENRKKEFNLTWSFDANNPYKAFKYLGGYTAVAKHPGGQAINYVVKGTMWPWEKLAEVTGFMMTDTSTAAQQELLREKVDVVTPDPPADLANLNRGIQTWLW